jgi:short subunit fatty acids transporter
MGNLEEQIRTETKRQEWIEYRNSVIENKSKSQDDFEKYINILASGALILSLTFFEKIVPLEKAIYKPFVITGMFLMVLTLLSNLYSHYKSITDSDSTIKEIDEEKHEMIFTNIEKRNKVINGLNKVSIWSLIIGILSLITFVTINIL